MADVAERASTALAPLPQSAALRILALLPVDARARCACVSRGWRSTVATESLWLRLDLSEAGGVPRDRVSSALLRGAAARARGHLQALDVSQCSDGEAILAVVRANARSLQELRHCALARCIWDTLRFDLLEKVLRAAPQLRVCEVDVACDAAQARRLLRGAAPFARVQLHGISLKNCNTGTARELAGLLTRHEPSVQVLAFVESPLDTEEDTAMAAVVDLALAQRIPDVSFCCCDLPSEAAPELARLLRGGALTSLRVLNGGVQLLEGRDDAELCAALRASRTLTALTVADCDLWRSQGGPALLRAVTRHASLRHLSFSGSHGRNESPTWAAAALGALVAANAPALQSLDVSCCWFYDAGLAPLVAALRRNTRLRTLKFDGMSGAFAASHLLPAVRANTSLRELEAKGYMGGGESDWDEEAYSEGAESEGRDFDDEPQSDEEESEVPVITSVEDEPALLEAEALVRARSAGGAGSVAPASAALAAGGARRRG